MNMKLKERPTFDQFKSYLLGAVAGHTGKNAVGGDSWMKLGDENKRSDILNSLKLRLEGEYGVELVLTDNIVAEDATIETISIKLHHVYSTVYLMERINNKIRRNK